MSPRRATLAAIVSVATAGVLVLGVGAAPASAAPSDGYASWTVAGTPGNFTGTLTLPAGFPATTVASTSSSFATSSGNSSYLPAVSPAGVLVGSSRAKPYVSINPTSTTQPSTTTFTFLTPTPVGVWGAAFGDIDAESLTITATDATGAPVAAADLGVTAFNYCDGAPNSCTAPPLPLVLPTLTSTATSVTAGDPLCPGTLGSCNSQGGSVWIAPLVALSTLSISSTFKAGSPAAQMWFASVARTVAGVITLGSLPPVIVELIDQAGDVVTSTTTAVDGSFTLPPVVPRADYRLRIDPAVAPDEPIVPIDVSVADAASVALDIAPAVVVAPDPVAAPAAVPPAPTLAATGIDSGPLLVAAGALTLIGAVGIAGRGLRPGGRRLR